MHGRDAGMHRGAVGLLSRLGQGCFVRGFGGGGALAVVWMG